MKINWVMVETVFKYTFLTLLGIASGALIIKAFMDPTIAFVL